MAFIHQQPTQASRPGLSPAHHRLCRVVIPMVPRHRLPSPTGARLPLSHHARPQINPRLHFHHAGPPLNLGTWVLGEDQRRQKLLNYRRCPPSPWAGPRRQPLLQEPTLDLEDFTPQHSGQRSCQSYHRHGGKWTRRLKLKLPGSKLPGGHRSHLLSRP